MRKVVVRNNNIERFIMLPVAKAKHALTATLNSYYKQPWISTFTKTLKGI
jgi:hypothetical protein